MLIKSEQNGGPKQFSVRSNLTREVLQYYLIIRLILTLLKQKWIEKETLRLHTSIETMIISITDRYGPTRDSPDF